MSFTKTVRLEIKERAGNCSELSGRMDRPLVCAHIIHRGKKGKRKKNRIDCIENGLYVTDIEHYSHHLIFRTNPKEIGLSHDENDLAIEFFRYVLYRDESITEEKVAEQISEAIVLWEEFYHKNKDQGETSSARTTSLLSAVQRG